MEYNMHELVILISGMFLVGLVIGLIGGALRKCVSQIIVMNERLMIIVADKQGGNELVKGLIASTKSQTKTPPVVISEEVQKGLRMTVGGRR
jgi:hypothetical protein